MPAIGGPNITEDGLVFAYDLGNVRSYKGEPTTNILNDNILGHGSSAYLGEDAVGKFIQLSDLTSNYSRFQLPSIPVSSNDTYTWSFELMSLEGIEPTNQMHFDTNEYSDQYPNSNDLSRASAIHRKPDSLVAGEWTPFSLTVTMKDGLTGAYTYDFFNFRYPVFRNKRIYYRNMQFEFKDHPTQYAGQGATRSNTESLIDLTGNRIIDVSSPSFDSNAKLTFDGTGDKIDTGITSENWGAENFSLEGWIKYDNVQHDDGWFELGRNPDDSSVFGLSTVTRTGRFYFYWINGEGVNGGHNFSSNAIANNQWIHMVITHSATNSTTQSDLYNNTKVYVNGVEMSHSPGGSANVTTTKKLFVGSQQYTFSGDIDIFKYYNRVLSPEQIAQNYNSTKNRFNS